MTDDRRRADPNGDLARIFHEIGDMLEVKGELVFKTVAYHRAADAIGRSPVDLVAAYRGGTPPRIPGVGAAISDKIAELATTGRMAFYERLEAEIPPGLVDLLRIPGLGPKTVRQLHADLGIDSIDDLRAAAEAGRCAASRACRRRPRRSSSRASPASTRRPAGCCSTRAETRVTDIIAALADTPGVRRIEPAGSFRRRKETIGDLDLLAETDDAARLIERFTGLGVVDHVVNRGGYKAAVRLLRGPQVDLMIMPPGEAGTYLIHFTGLEGAQRPAPRDGARPGLEPVGEGLPADRRGRRAADRRRRRAPDVRDRDRGLRVPRPAVHRARAARGPRRDRGGAGRPAADAHHRRPTCAATCTATRTGPTAPTPIEVMAEAARRRGYAYQVLTDHSQSLAIARGLTPERVARAARDHRDAQRAVRRRGGGGHGAARDPARGLPAAPRLRAGDPGRRPARLRGRAARERSTSSSPRSTSRVASRGPS